MLVKILGCGCSIGAPVIGCECITCKSNDIKNKRTRSSIFITLDNGKQILIDVSPDVKAQLINNNIIKIDEVILTHAHNDHVNGLNDLNYLNFLGINPSIYATEDTLEEVFTRFHFIKWLKKTDNEAGFIYNKVNYYDNLNIDGENITLFKQNHGKGYSLGVRIKDFIYSTDVSEFPIESEPFLENAKIWVLDCISHEGTKKHLGWEQVLKLKEKFKPETIYITHMSHKMEYNYIFNQGKELNIKPVYDNMFLVI